MRLLSISLKSLIVIAIQVGLIANANAKAKPEAGDDKLDGKAFYTISTEVGGKKQALTFKVPEGDDIQTLTNYASKAKVVAEPLRANDKSQLWQFHENGADFIIFSKISDQTEALTGTLIVTKINGDFSGPGDDKFHDTYNRLTVGPNNNQFNGAWSLTKQKDGRYKLAVLNGIKANLTDKKSAPEYGWHEERILEAVKGSDGQVKLRHTKDTNAPGQLWTLTKSGY